MSIKHDEAGFLLGEKRITELSKGVSDVSNKTTEILELLYALIQLDMKERQVQSGERQRIADSLVRMTGGSSTQKVELSIVGQSGPKTKVVGGKVVLHADIPTKATSKTQVVRSVEQGRIGKAFTTGATTAESQARDESGRFVGKAQGINDKATFIDSIKRGLDSSNLSPDVGGIDPTVDALRELHGVFSPAGRAFGLMGRGANWLFKKAKPRKAEDIPRVQGEHYTEVERHNYEQRKLFKKLIDAVNRQNSSGILGKLAGLASLLSALASGGGVSGRNGKNAPPVPVPDKNKKTDKPVPDRNVPDNQKKAGRMARLFGKVPFVGALLGGGVLASQWGDMSAVDKAGGVGALAGGAIGGIAGSIAGPVGSVGGALAGAHIGDKIGQKFGEWTGTLKGQDVGGAIVNKWNETVDGIDKLVKYSWLRSITGLGGITGGGFMRASYGGSGGYGDYSGGGSSAVIKSSTTKEQSENQDKVYKSMIKAGFSQQQALALTAEVGRENGYDAKYLYGSHKDAANGKKNIGMISWQGTRGTKLYAYMKEQGLINADGSMVQGQASLDAQARFIRHEIENESSYAATKAAFGNKDTKAENLSKVLGKNYIGWAYGQNRLKSGEAFDWKAHDAKRRGYLDQIEKKVGDTGSQAPINPRTVYVGADAKAVHSAQPVKISGSSGVNRTNIPAVPAVKKLESTKDQPVWASNQGGISQSPADRDLAHALTGGMGMRTLTA